MPDDRPATARTLAEAAEAQVVHLVPNLLEHLLGLSVAARVPGSDHGCNRCLSEIEHARQVLAHEFDAGFREANIAVTSEVMQARDDLIAALDRILPRLPDVGDNIDATLTTFADSARQDLQSVVARFLSALYTFVVATEKADARDLNQSDATAVEQIDLITGQINLIAINASIEAARAGEVGKGFAVIAAEIQELSRQSKAALDRIRAELA